MSDMNDNMDGYLSRTMKNWAARQRVPAGSRERLLQMAAHPTTPPESLDLLDLLRRALFGPVTLKHDEPALGPFSQSRTWSFHVATSMRMVA
jgi:hypothetical protein